MLHQLAFSKLQTVKYLKNRPEEVSFENTKPPSISLKRISQSI
jgi:hypothetical protein